MEVTKMHSDVKLPTLATPQSVGADVHAYLKSETGRPIKMALGQGATRVVPTGLIIRPAPGHFIMVCSRSGLAIKSVFVTNAPGIIDPDYRGEIKVLLYNASYETQWIEHGDRIAQLVETIAYIPGITEADHDLRGDETSRGERGFGSSGR